MSSSSSIASLGCLYLFWHAQQRLSRHIQSKEPDSELNDPLEFTAIKTFFFGPSLLAPMFLKVIKLLLLIIPGLDSELPTRAWQRVLNTHTKYELLKMAYLSGLATYLGFGLPNLFVDYFRWPRALYAYKIQKDAEVDYQVMLPRLAITLAQNIMGPVFLSFLLSREHKERVAEFIFERYLSISPTLPSFWEVTRNYWSFLMTYDILFFYSHYALHSKTLYAKIHKKHHEWKTPTALAAAYAHPVEHILSNVAPAAVPLRFSKQHLLSFLLYVHVGLLVTLTDHSGYEVVSTSAAHDIHHRTFTSNFGVSGLLDRVHGTRVYDKHEERKSE